MWDDTRITLAPNATEVFDLDIVVLNISIVNIHIRTTDTILLQIKERSSSAPVVFEQKIFRNPDIFGDIFWTYPYRGTVWWIILPNENPISVNVTVKITENFLGLPKTREVTHYDHIIDPNFIYVGLMAIVAGFTLTQKKRPVGEQTPSTTYARSS